MPDIKVGDRVDTPQTIEQFNAVVFPKTENCKHENHYACKHCLQPLADAAYQSALADAKENLSKLEPWRKEALAAAFNTDVAIFSNNALHNAGLNTTTAPYRHDLPKDGALVQEGEKEAVIDVYEQLNPVPKHVSRCGDGYGQHVYMLTDDYSAGYAERYKGFKQAWQHQQAVVATLTEALDIKEQLNQKLREREEELQKRVGAVQALIQEWRADSYNYRKDGNRSASDVIWFAAKDLEQALGADHEAPPKTPKVGWFACVKAKRGRQQ